MDLLDLKRSTAATISRSDAASLLGVDPRTITEGIKAGQIPSVHVSRRVAIPREPLLTMLTQQFVPLPVAPSFEMPISAESIAWFDAVDRADRIESEERALELLRRRRGSDPQLAAAIVAQAKKRGWKSVVAEGVEYAPQ